MRSDIEILRYFQRKAGPYVPRSKEDIFNHRSQQVNIEPSILKEIMDEFDFSTLEKQEEFLQSTIVKPFVEALPHDSKSKLEEIYVGFLPTCDPNAIVMATDPPLVILHDELIKVVHFFEELGLINVDPKGKNIDREFMMNVGLQYVLKCFVDTTSTTVFPKLPPILDVNSLMILVNLVHIQILFVVAHEFAHIYLGHLQEVEMLTLSSRGNAIKFKKYNKDQRDEFEADLQAIRWLIHVRNNPNYEFFPIRSRLFISHALRYFVLNHFVEINTKIPSKWDTHPPSIDRLQYIYQECKGILERDELEGISNLIEQCNHMPIFKNQQ